MARFRSDLSCVLAQAQMHDMDMPMAVGRVDFSNSCSPSAKRDLNSGMAALYSFWFSESHQSFEKAAAARVNRAQEKL